MWSKSDVEKDIHGCLMEILFVLIAVCFIGSAITSNTWMKILFILLGTILVVVFIGKG